MTYAQFKQAIQQKKRIDDFYKLLIQYRTDILKDIDYYTQTEVAKQLNITPAKFNGIVAILRALPQQPHSQHTK